MDLYGEKKNAIRTVVFLCAIWLAFFVADLVQEDVVFSENENRILASRPEFTTEALLDGMYMKEYETYINDQFVGRKNWITIKTGMDILLQKKEINGVYLAKDDYLIERHTAEEFEGDKLRKRIESLQKIIKEYPQTKVMLVPTADNILTNKLPAFAPFYDQQQLLKQVKTMVGKERVIDVMPILKEHAEESIYYRTDHHWTTLGAYYGYREFARAYGLPFRNYLNKEKVAVTQDFLGTLHSKVNMPRDGENIEMFPATLDKKYTITYDKTKHTNSFYTDSYLEGKNKYGYFLDDNHGLVEIERESFSTKELFIIKDSYANSMIPLLAHHYKKIYVVDLRYFNGKLLDFMQECDSTGNMDVLVLYNCVHFVEDFQFQ
ncbi:MAG: hypothetical protein IKK33_10720 [Lachnospiraceae bacterium]|nr:hypothetical protein [Lachnospiraceae bacterium]